MREYSSCKDAIGQCIESRQFSIAHMYKEEKAMDIHIHDCYEIYYSISGGKQFLIGDRLYDIEPGNLFVINNYESHYLAKIDQVQLERIVINVYPEYLTELSTSNTQLAQCFTRQDGEFAHRIQLNPEQQSRFMYYVNKILSASESGFGGDVLIQAAFMELMIFINTLYRVNQPEAEDDKNYKYSSQVSAIITYINSNIMSNISIEHLAEHFFMSSSYLCRTFKSVTGTTINKYIIARRISIAKSLLAAGVSVNDACEQCGFNDYTNFLKAFTKAVGISPKKYASNSYR